MTDSRYPYTHACDYIRHQTSMTADGCTLSRSDASRIIEGVAAALGIEERAVAEYLADEFLRLDDNDHQKKVEEFLLAKGWHR